MIDYIIIKLRNIQDPVLKMSSIRLLSVLAVVCLTACASAKGASDVYKDPNMDFGAVKTVAVLPFTNLTRDQAAAERVRDVFVNMLQATGAVYVVPTGEVARGIMRSGTTTPNAPSTEEIKKIAGAVSANTLILGVLKEYGEVRSGNSSANVISLSLQMIEAETGRVVWTASSTEGGISTWDRLFGGGGRPLNDITEKAVNDLIDKLFK